MGADRLLRAQPEDLRGRLEGRETTNDPSAVPFAYVQGTQPRTPSMRATARLLLSACLLSPLATPAAEYPDGVIGSGYGSVFGRTVVSEFPAGPGESPYLGAMALSATGRSWLFGEYSVFHPDQPLPIARLDTASGALDAGFGGGTGVVATALPLAGGWLHDMDAVVQPDGKPLLAGSVRLAEGDRGFVCRFNVAGNPDATFGDDGCALVRAFAFTNERCDLQAIALGSPGGGITVAGHCSDEESSARQAFTARLTASGLPDTEYGAGAGVTLPVVAGSALTDLMALVLLEDGRFMAVGSARRDSNQHDIALLRMSNDGTPDPEYGDGGNVLLAVDLAGALHDHGTDIALRPDGRVLVAGIAQGQDDQAEVVLWQTSAEGIPDATFGSNGLVIGSEPLDEVTHNAGLATYYAGVRLAIDDLGRAVVVGRDGIFVDTDANIRVFRFRADGSLDAAFAYEGRGVVDIDHDVSVPGPGASHDVPAHVSVQRERILIGATAIRDDVAYMVTVTLEASHLFSDGYEGD